MYRKKYIMDDLVVCIVCGSNVEVSKATDVSSEGSPVYVGNACLPGYFAWQELQAVRSYVEYEAALFAADIHPIPIPMEDDLVHTDERIFCDDSLCGCHEDRELFDEHIHKPWQAGLLSEEETFRIHWNRHIWQEV